MKKSGFVMCIFILAALLIPGAQAAEPSVFVDTLEDDYPLVYDKSEWMRYEKNADTGSTFYEKLSETGDFTTAEYVTYRMEESVIGFAVDCMHVNGLGDAKTDVSVFVSRDNVDWAEVKTSVSPQTYDEELYVNEDMAYWRLSTVTNAGPIEPGYTYLKVQINPFSVKGSVVWNTVLDTITIEYGEIPPEPVQEEPAEEVRTPEPAQEPAENKDAADPAEELPDKGFPAVAVGVAAVAAAAGGGAVFLAMRKKG